MDNREKIFACALELFYQKGYDSVGIQEICTESGITKPTLYHYFGSKYGLLEQILEQELKGTIEELNDVVAEKQGIEAKLDRFAAVLFDFAQKNTKAYMLLMSLSYSAKENEVYKAVKPYLTSYYTAAVRMFEQESEQLGNMNGRQKQFAIGFLGLINHYLMFLGYKEETDSVSIVTEEARQSLIRQFMYGIWT